ncbi:MAG: MFS transporter [Pseudonocardiaceae bacterium]|nr:MFS transporter [Pseudonocardiaceae bacterium]
MADERPRRSGLVLGLLCLAQFLVVLDTTIVNVALPGIGADLGFTSEAGLQYVISLYALTFGGLMIAAGRAADLLGRRRLLVVGLLVFTLASLTCGAAPNAGVLLTARVVQGVGSALVSSSALALLTSLFAEGTARNRALGAWGAVGGGAGACGLILGGTLTDLLGWPSIFLINVPIGLAAAWVAPRLLPAGDRGNVGLDLPGAVTLTAGLGLLILGLSQGGHAGFGADPVIGVLAGAVALLAAFAVIQRRASHPLVAPRLLRVPGVAAANIAALTLTMIVASSLFFTTLYVQQVLGLTALQTGLAFLPNSVLVVAGSALATRLRHRLGPGVILVAGFAILIVAGLLLSGVSADGTYVTAVLPGFALIGFGQGMAFVAAISGATRSVADSDHGLASGVVNSAQQVGFAVGLAAVISAAVALAGPGARPVVSYATGYLLDSALAAVGLLISLALVRTRRSGKDHAPVSAVQMRAGVRIDRNGRIAFPVTGTHSASGRNENEGDMS